MDRAQRPAAAGERHPFDLSVHLRTVMTSITHDPDNGRTLRRERKMAAPAADIMMPPEQCPVGKGEGKAIRHRAGGQVENGLDIAAQP